MRRRRSLLRHALFAALVAAALASAAEAQRAHDVYPFRVSLFGGVGGAYDAEPSGDLDHSSYQLGFSWISDYDLQVGLRYGQVAWDDDEALGGRTGSDLTYLTAGGEYLFNEGYYRSGIYLGLGWYRLDEDVAAEISSDSALGLALGITGDFRLTDRFSILIELSGHYTDLDDADILAMGHAGIAFRF
ncbi:MAG TPA: outer membrane beta-barrel protein, partial [Thermoanaerobaculia bacterium]|nr:outer membrane beta-barrel protein [Thermoanaerobaculia bacterium]